jgi:hypothetical protein
MTEADKHGREWMSGTYYTTVTSESTTIIIDIRTANITYRHVKMGRSVKVLSRRHTCAWRCAMYTMRDVRLWDGDGGGEARKRSGGGGPRDCHGADSGRPIRHLGRLNQVDPDIPTAVAR